MSTRNMKTDCNPYHVQPGCFVRHELTGRLALLRGWQTRSAARPGRLVRYQAGDEVNRNAPGIQIDGANDFCRGRQEDFAALFIAHDIDVVAAGSDYLRDGAKIAVIVRKNIHTLDLVVVKAAGGERRQFRFRERDIGTGD